MGQLRFKSLRFALFLLGILSLLYSQPSFASNATQSGAADTKTFRWIHANTDPNLWEEILAAFSDELQPDQANSGQSDLDVYRYKYVQKIGVVNHSALVIIGRRPAKEVSEENKWDEYNTAFNFDLLTKRKAEIDHATVMWLWRFVKVARFGPADVPDITYTYLSCTECEADTIFSALHFDERAGTWSVRSWGDGKEIWWAISTGMVVDFDPAASDTISLIVFMAYATWGAQASTVL